MRNVLQADSLQLGTWWKGSPVFLAAPVWCGISVLLIWKKEGERVGDSSNTTDSDCSY